MKTKLFTHNFRHYPIEKLSLIFPSDESKKQYWIAGWSAYVRLSDVYTSVFPALIPYYQIAVDSLPYGDMENSFIQTGQALATHIHKAFLLDLIQLDSKDMLVKLFYQKATDEIRSQGVFWLSKVMESQKPERTDKVWEKIWNLWQWRLGEAVDNLENKTNYQKEISNYLRLLRNVPLNIDDMADIIMKTIQFIRREEFETGLILDYLAKQSLNYVDMAVAHLYVVITNSKDLHLLPSMKINITTIFENAEKENTSYESKQKVIEIINIFGGWGDYSWRPWLEKMV